jgi:hypothetical protein
MRFIRFYYDLDNPVFTRETVFFNVKKVKFH